MRLALVLALALVAAPAAAQPTDPPPTFDEAVPPPAGAPITADDWLRVGLARYDSGDYKGAVDAFILGNQLDPRPQFLFAIAQAERRRGDCKAASIYYTKFLAASPPIEQADAAREQLHRCEAAVVTAPPPPPPKPAPPRVIVKLAPPPPRAPAWWHDPITDGVGLASIVGASAGLGLILSADAAAGAAASAPTYQEHGTLAARAHARMLDGEIALSVGAALGAITTWRIWHGGHWRHHEHRLTAAPGPGVGLALGGSF